VELELNIKNSIAMYRRALKVVPGASQTNSKRLENYAPGAFPIFLQKGKGSHVWDVDGNEYIDYGMAMGPIILGYAYSKVDEEVKKRIDDGLIFTLPHPLEVELAEELSKTVPCAEMSRFVKGGGEACACAIRVARAYTGRNVVLRCGYHGQHDVFNVGTKGVPEILNKYTFAFEYNSLESLERLVKEHKNDIACIIMTPTDTRTRPSNDFLKGVRELADECGAVLIFDEVVTGFRISLGGAQEYFKVTPDIAVFAKAMANGYPIAAYVGKKEVMREVTNCVLTTTYGGETASLTAALTTIHEIKERNVIEYIWKLGEKLMSGLESIISEVGIDAKVGGWPPMMSLDFKEDNQEKRREMRYLFLQETAKRGILIRPDAIFICYSHTEHDINRTLIACYDALKIVKEAAEKNELDAKLKVKDTRLLL
jgi:glutamate-1-semialdehyde-2,1-aminomutase